MLYSKEIMDNVLKFFKTNIDPQTGNPDNFYTALTTIAAHYGKPITRPKWFEMTKPVDSIYPAGIVYEENTTYRQETLNQYVKQYHIAVIFSDQESSVDQVRLNLYAYRDALTYLVEKYADLHGICNQVINPSEQPPTIWTDTGSFSGFVTYKFILEIII